MNVKKKEILVTLKLKGCVCVFFLKLWIKQIILWCNIRKYPEAWIIIYLEKMVNFSVFVLVNDELTKHPLSYRLGTLTHFLHPVFLACSWGHLYFDAQVVCTFWGVSVLLCVLYSYCMGWFCSTKLFPASPGPVKGINVNLWAASASHKPCRMAVYTVHTPCCISLSKVTLTYPTVTFLWLLCVCAHVCVCICSK